MNAEASPALTRFDFTAGLLRGTHFTLYATCLVHRGEQLLESFPLAAIASLRVAYERDPRKLGWGEMPFLALMSELGQRASGRLIRADDPWLADATAPTGFPIPSGAIRALRRGPLWVELDLV